MKASDLLRCQAVRQDGRELGHVLDIRARRDQDGGLTVTGVVVGERGLAERLGYARGVVEGPWVVAAALRWFHRSSRVVPWEQITEVRDGRLVVRDDGGAS